MDRRTFLATLLGGLAAATSGAALAQAATEPPQTPPAPAELDSEALDRTEAEFSHMPPGRRWREHRAWHRRQRRRHRRWHRRMRRRWRRGRWHYYYY